MSVRNYGGGQGPIWLHDVTCTGSERDLMYCAHGDWGKGQCIHDEDVALECKTAGGGPAPSRPTPAPSRPGPAPVPEPLKPGNLKKLLAFIFTLRHVYCQSKEHYSNEWLQYLQGMMKGR